MYYSLTSNIETLNERGLDAKSKEIGVAVLLSDVLKKNVKPTFYAQRYGMVYDPQNEFKPNVTPYHKLPSELIEEYFIQLPKAREEYATLLEQLNTRFKGQGKDNSEEIKELQQLLRQKEDRISDQARRIDELSRKQSNGNGNELSQMLDMLKEMKSNRIEIKINNSVKIIEEIVHEKFSQIVEFVAKKQALYLYGEAGTGKSEIAKQVAKALDLDFYPSSTLTQEFKLSGYQDGNGKYHETNFYKAMKYGGLFFLDEMDSCHSDVLVGINGALANGYYDFPHETVTAHDNFRVVSAGNTIGRGGNVKYNGRYPLDMSTLDRFWGMKIDYSPTIDKAVANGDMELVEFANSVRNASITSGINIIMSYRSIKRIAEFQDMLTLKEIMEMAVIKGMASDDINMLIRNMEILPSNKYFKAFKQAI